MVGGPAGNLRILDHPDYMNFRVGEVLGLLLSCHLVERMLLNGLEFHFGKSLQVPGKKLMHGRTLFRKYWAQRQPR